MGVPSISSFCRLHGFSLYLVSKLRVHDPDVPFDQLLDEAWIRKDTSEVPKGKEPRKSTKGMRSGYELRL